AGGDPRRQRCALEGAVVVADGIDGGCPAAGVEVVEVDRAGGGGSGGADGRVGVRRVADDVGGADAVVVGGAGAGVGVAVAGRVDAGDGDVGEGRAVGRALDLEAAFVVGVVDPGQVDR